MDLKESKQTYQYLDILDTRDEAKAGVWRPFFPVFNREDVFWNGDSLMFSFQMLFQ